MELAMELLWNFMELLNGQQMEFGFDIETNSKVIDFLNITFNLNNGIYKPYKKQTIDRYI